MTKIVRIQDRDYGRMADLVRRYQVNVIPETGRLGERSPSIVMKYPWALTGRGYVVLPAKSPS